MSHSLYANAHSSIVCSQVALELLMIQANAIRPTEHGQQLIESLHPFPLSPLRAYADIPTAQPHLEQCGGY